MTLLILTDAGFVHAGDYTPSASLGGRRQVTGAALHQQLAEALSGREVDDILVALQDEDLRLLDGIASALPLCRTMERTRNTKLQQRTHLRTWLDRGYGEVENMAAGHIRWGKLIQGLVGKLGEFTVRHVGPAPIRGQLIRVEVGDGQLATGYAAADGTPIAAEIVVSSKAKLRSEMAATLRRFGAATRMMAAINREAA
jgi:hypothetical protein